MMEFFIHFISAAEGCEKVVELEHLLNHCTNCKHNPNAEIECGKGCNRKIRRHEQQTHNCLEHLSILLHCQEEQVRQLEERNNALNCVAREEHKSDIRRLEEQIDALNRTVLDEQKSENRRLEQNIDALNRVAREEHKSEIRRLETQIDALNRKMENMDFLLKLKRTWHTWDSICKLGDTLTCLKESLPGYAQSICPLGLGNSSFKVEILNLSVSCSVSIELNFSSTGSTLLNGSIYLASNGINKFQDYTHPQREKFAVGDIIECGIENPQNLNRIGSTEIVVYFSKNGNLISKKSLQVQADHLYPTIYLYGGGTKVKILEN